LNSATSGASGGSGRELRLRQQHRAAAIGGVAQHLDLGGNEGAQLAGGIGDGSRHLLEPGVVPSGILGQDGGHQRILARVGTVEAHLRGVGHAADLLHARCADALPVEELLRGGLDALGCLGPVGRGAGHDGRVSFL
jgi:hypothetical protein